MNKKIKIKKDGKINVHRLIWKKKERTEIESRALNLRNDQIGALAKILLGFNDKDIKSVVDDIRKNGKKSGHLPILLEESESKEKVAWWLNYFERANRK